MGMSREQPSYLIKIDPDFHTSRMPDLHPRLTTMKPEPRRAYLPVVANVNCSFT
jgi:hypothetical protein